MIFSLLYDLVQYLIFWLVGLISPFNAKLKKWYIGRKKVWSQLPPRQESSIWFHLASLGEYEQAKPVIEQLAKQYGEQNIVLTFFSPSGYEIVASKVPYPTYYLPLDTQKNAERFINQIKPRLVLFTKYDLWYQMIRCLRLQSIPRVLISAVFEQNKYYFKWYGRWMKRELKGFDAIFTQTKKDLLIAQKYGLKAEHAGDTRVDRSLSLPDEPWNGKELEEWKGLREMMVAASVHQEDLDIVTEIIKSLDEECCLIVAPHNIDEHSIKWWMKRLEGAQTKSSIDIADKTGPIILDSMGELKYVYRYAAGTYIGGGFGSGIHNILEPFSYGIPTSFGPNHDGFHEAKSAVQNGWAVIFEPNNTKTVAESLLKLSKNKEIKPNIRAWMKEQSGATEKVVQWINSKLRDE